MSELKLECGLETESLVQVFLSEITDEQLDEVDVRRTYAPALDLASEPLAVAATIVATPLLFRGVLRFLEKWLENRRQESAFRIVASGFERSSAEGRALARLAERHAEVSIAFDVPDVSGRSER